MFFSPRRRLLRLFAGLLWCVWACLPARGQAQAPLDVAKLKGGVQLAPHLGVLEDASSQLTFEQVRATSYRARFMNTNDSPDLGFSASTLWARFEAKNETGERARWLLELAYPHLDHVTLYVVRASGAVEEHATGDLLPFAQRDLVHPNFVFTLENAPLETITCYLSVKTSGTLRAPLTAWHQAEYLDHELRNSIVLWMFFGALIMMALYNAAVWALIRQGEYLTQALLLLSIWAVTFTFGGHTFQFLLPDHPVLANRALTVFLSLTLCTGSLSCSQVAARSRGYEPYRRIFRRAAYVAAALTFIVCFMPKQLGLLCAVVGLVVYVSGGLVCIVVLSGRPDPQLRLYIASWWCLLIGVPLSVLSYVSILPEHFLLHWAGHIGCAMQAIFTSLALAARVKLMGDDLGVLNEQLSSQNVDLIDALESTREANHEAQRATKAKDEFMATMSHELRTPLNAIINVPQGLLENFRDARSAVCGACHADFLLEPGETIDASTVCIECQQLGSLREDTTTLYEGDLAQAARFLRKIERSGKHLLHMVNGVLDFSKMEVGRLELQWDEIDLALLLRDVVEEMSELARERDQVIELQLTRERLSRIGDSTRIKQVLLNLLANAIKFSDKPGTILVRCVRERDADVVSVRDEGIGIAPEHQERIFERFEQVHKGDVRKYGGTGLGLSISRSLVRMHGGELWADSRLGEGSTFTFRLPLQVRKRPSSGNHPRIVART